MNSVPVGRGASSGPLSLVLSPLKYSASPAGCLTLSGANSVAIQPRGGPLEHINHLNVIKMINK